MRELCFTDCLGQDEMYDLNRVSLKYEHPGFSQVQVARTFEVWLEMANNSTRNLHALAADNDRLSFRHGFEG